MITKRFQASSMHMKDQFPSHMSLLDFIYSEPKPNEAK